MSYTANSGSYPTLDRLPPVLQQDNGLKSIYRSSVTAVNKQLDCARTCKLIRPEDGFNIQDWSNGAVHSIKTSGLAIKALCDHFKELAQRNGVDHEPFISAWTRTEGMAVAETQCAHAQMRMIHQATNKQKNVNTMRDAAKHFVENYNSAIDKVEEVFDPYYNVFISKEKLDKDIAQEIKPAIRHLVFGVSPGKKGVERVLQDKEEDLSMYFNNCSLSAVSLLQGIVREEYNKIKPSGDLSRANFLEEEEPELNLADLIDNCEWPRTIWATMKSIRKEHEDKKAAGELNDHFKTVTFDKLTGKAGKNRKRKDRPEGSGSAASQKQRKHK